jgi:hypothetical protein
VAADTIHIPVGDWVTALASVLGTILVAALTRALSYAPAAVKTLLTEQLLKRAVDYGMAAVAGAVPGKALDIKVANSVIREAAQYAVDHGAPWLLKYIGDLGPKLAARLSAAGSLPAEASTATLNMSPTIVLSK